MRIRRATATSEELATFAEAVRATVPEAPGPGLEAAVVSRLAQEASAAAAVHGDQPTEQLPGLSRAFGTWRPRLALAAQVAAVVALVPLVTAGLAVAGVTLPEPARDAFDRVGIELPNQPGEQSSSDRDAGGKPGRNPSGNGSQPAGQKSTPSGGAGRQPAGKDTSGGSTNPPPVSRGQGEPKHGAPAPIVPPGQGGTPPGHDGTPPGNSEFTPGHTGTAPGQAKETGAATGGGSPGGVPPGQAKK